MTRAIFGEWLEDFDRDMGRQGRKVCLLLDNFSAHNVEDVALENVELKFFLQNCSSIIQPHEQGVIESVKWAYRKCVIHKLLLNAHTSREMKIDLFMVLQMLAASWCATSGVTIANCFRHAGFAAPAAETSGADRDDDDVLSSARAPCHPSVFFFFLFRSYHLTPISENARNLMPEARTFKR